MADKYVNAVGVQIIKAWIEGKFALDADLDALSDRVDDIIAEGGEPNTIETISVNGTNVPPDANKNVELTVQETLVSGTNIKTINNTSLLGNGNIDIEDVFVATYGTTSYADVHAAIEADKVIVLDAPVGTVVPSKIMQGGGSEYVFFVLSPNEADLTTTPPSTKIKVRAYMVNGTGWSDETASLGGNLATEAYVDENGGKIDVIKVNGTTQTITNKTVDIAVPDDLSDLTNTGQDPYAKVSDVESAVVGALKPKGSVAFASLPALSAANLNNMYNVSDAFTTTADFIEGAGVSYPAGTNVAIVNVGSDASPTYKYDAMVGTTDLSAYWTSTSGQNNTLEAMTVAEINAILEPTTP